MNNVVYTVTGKMFFVKDPTELLVQMEYYIKKSGSHICNDLVKFYNGPLAFNDDFSLLRTSCTTDSQVLMINIPLESYPVVQGNRVFPWSMWFGWDERFYLIDGCNEGRLLYDVEIPVGNKNGWADFSGGKKGMKYIYDVIKNFMSWKDYDDAGTMMNPAEEILHEHDMKAKRDSESRDNRRKAMDIVNQLTKVNGWRRWTWFKKGSH